VYSPQQEHIDTEVEGTLLDRRVTATISPTLGRTGTHGERRRRPGPLPHRIRLRGKPTAEGEDPLPLCRLRLTGCLHTWAFALYLASLNGHQDNFLSGLCRHWSSRCARVPGTQQWLDQSSLGMHR
jgi:hypothetical protein